MRRTFTVARRVVRQLLRNRRFLVLSIVAHDAFTGKPLWHSKIGNVTNAPQTYMLDGRQYLLVAAGDTLYSFTLY